MCSLSLLKIWQKMKETDNKQNQNAEYWNREDATNSQLNGFPIKQRERKAQEDTFPKPMTVWLGCLFRLRYNKYHTTEGISREYFIFKAVFFQV